MSESQTNRRVAFITGASSGIGRALALQLASEGYDLGVFARRLSLLQELKDEITAAHDRKVEISACDVTQRGSVEASFTELLRVFGHCDLLVANAGVGRYVTVDDFDTDVIGRLFATNYMGVMHAIAQVLPGMISRRSGHIVGISSVAAYRGYPTTHPYCATKAALNTSLEGLRAELLGHNVKVTTVCPGFIETPMTAENQFPMPFIMSAENAARRIGAAIRAKKKVLNFPWQIYWLVRLASFFPDWFFAPKRFRYTNATSKN